MQRPVTTKRRRRFLHATASTRSRHEADARERAVGSSERVVARVARREHGARAVGGAPKRAEDVAGLAVDADAAHALDARTPPRARARPAARRAARRGSARTRRRRRPRRELLRVHRLAERARDRERIEVDAERDAAELRVVAAADARRHLREQRPVVAEQDLHRRRAVLDAERARRSGRRLDRRADVGGLEVGGPAVRERDAERRRRRLLAVGDGQRDEVAVEGERVDGDDVAADELLDEAVLAARLGERGRRGARRARRGRARARRRARRRGPAPRSRPGSRAPRRPARPRRATGRRASAAARSPPPRAARAASAARRRATPSPGVSGCGRPSRSAIRAASATAWSVPGAIDAVDLLGAREPLDRGLVLDRDDRAAVGVPEAGRRRVAVGRRRPSGRAPARRRARRAARDQPRGRASAPREPFSRRARDDSFGGSARRPPRRHPAEALSAATALNRRVVLAIAAAAYAGVFADVHLRRDARARARALPLHPDLPRRARHGRGARRARGRPRGGPLPRRDRADAAGAVDDGAHVGDRRSGSSPTRSSAR